MRPLLSTILTLLTLAATPAASAGGWYIEALVGTNFPDELDFSIETFSFVNIGKSRHRGVEAGAKLYVQDRATVFFNYTLQNVTSRFGTFEGNYVKAISRDFISAGLNVSHGSGLGGSFTINAARRIFLDDANTISLPNYTTADARLAYERRPFTLALDVFNFLAYGELPDGEYAAGSMEPVVEALGTLTPSDREALADYLHSVPPMASGVE